MGPYASDRPSRSPAAGTADGTDRRPPPPAPDSGHHEVASDRGGQRAATMYSLIATARMNDVDPQAWLADVLARINDLPSNRIDELLPWNWSDSPPPLTVAVR